MKKKPDTPPDAQDFDVRTERALYEYLRRTGKIIPQSTEDIAEALAALKPESVTLPECLRAALVIEKACDSPGRIIKMPPRQAREVVENLARAAREGGTISPEVEAQMKRDRERAEREANGDK